MNFDQTECIRAHVAAVSRLLLGNKKMGSGVMIMAGGSFGPLARLELARIAVESQVDIVYLSFDLGEGGIPVMTGINLLLPRGAVCHISANCCLSLLPGRAVAVIVPRQGGSFHYKALSDEILQVRGRPESLSTGFQRAATKLAALVRNGVDVAQQVVIHDHIAA